MLLYVYKKKQERVGELGWLVAGGGLVLGCSREQFELN
jgi:hypothetical protein